MWNECRPNLIVPERVRVFCVPTENGAVYGVTSPAGAQNVTLTALSQPVTLRITRSPMVMAGVNPRGCLTACESDGLVMVGDRKVVEATASVMMFTLDGKPIEESEAVVLLPQPEVPADFTCRLGKNIDLLEIGDVQGGSWHTRDQSAAVRVSDGLKFHVDADQSLSVVLLTRHADRDKTRRTVDEIPARLPGVRLFAMNNQPLAIGIDIGGSGAKGALVAPDGQILAKSFAVTNDEDARATVLTSYEAMIRELLGQAESLGRPVEGIGVGVPAISMTLACDDLWQCSLPRRIQSPRPFRGPIWTARAIGQRRELRRAGRVLLGGRR